MKRKKQNLMAGILSLSVTFTALQPVSVCAAEISQQPKNPTHNCVTEDMTEWDQITFGMYPQTQITGNALTDEIINAEYDAETGDAVVDGVRYRRMQQDDANTTMNYKEEENRYFRWEPIQWNVLAADGDDLFVMAAQEVDCKRYHEERTDVTWKESDLRAWLNQDFYEAAFSEEEQAEILTTDVQNDKNSIYGISGGKNTSDRIYLLSEGELATEAYGFCSRQIQEEERISQSKNFLPTDYAYSRGVTTSKLSTDTKKNGSTWWLRSPGRSQKYALDVSNGICNTDGDGIMCSNVGVVPVMHLKRSAITAEMFKNPVHTCIRDHVSTWDTVSMGSYPGAEVTGDALTDQIRKASYDASGDATVAGTKYRRILKEGTADSYTYYKWEAILWRVLYNDGEILYLAAEKALDAKAYDEIPEGGDFSDTGNQWSDSTLRQWMNQEFYQTAFGEAERSAIAATELNNPSDSSTTDHIFCLFQADLLNPDYGFCEETTAFQQGRSFVFSDYAQMQRQQYVEKMTNEYGSWSMSDDGVVWTRTAGRYSNYTTSIKADGSVDTYGEQVDDGGVGVVPAMRVSLASDVWKYNPEQKPSDGKDDTGKDDSGKDNTGNSGQNNSSQPGSASGDTTQNNTPDNGTVNNGTTNNGTSDSGLKDSASPTASAVNVRKIKVTLPSRKLAAGTKIKLRTTVTPADAAQKKLTYKVSNQKYASVSKKGVLKLKKAGAGHTVKLTVSAQDGSRVRTSCTIKIMKHAVKKIRLSAGSLAAGKSIMLNTEVMTTGKKANTKLKYKSSNTRYATVDQKGRIKAKKAGKGKTVTITAVSLDGTDSKAKVRIKIR